MNVTRYAKRYAEYFQFIFYSTVPLYNETFNIQTQIMLLVLYGNDEKLGISKERNFIWAISNFKKREMKFDIYFQELLVHKDARMVF